MSDKAQKVYTLKVEFKVKFTGNCVEHANFEYALRAIKGLLALAKDAAIGLYVALQNNLMISNSGVIAVDLQKFEWEEIDERTDQG